MTRPTLSLIAASITFASPAWASGETHFLCDDLNVHVEGGIEVRCEPAADGLHVDLHVVGLSLQLNPGDIAIVSPGNPRLLTAAPSLLDVRDEVGMWTVDWADAVPQAVVPEQALDLVARGASQSEASWIRDSWLATSGSHWVRWDGQLVPVNLLAAGTGRDAIHVGVVTAGSFVGVSPVPVPTT